MQDLTNNNHDKDDIRYSHHPKILPKDINDSVIQYFINAGWVYDKKSGTFTGKNTINERIAAEIVNILENAGNKHI